MSEVSPQRFRALVEKHFLFLAAHGFRRSPADEIESTVGTSVAYVGNHLGFLVGWDVRDRQVDVRVVRTRDGRIIETGEGGYSRDLLAHLVEHAGYRGGMARPSGARPNGDALEDMVASWAALLRTEGASLLADEARALSRE